MSLKEYEDLWTEAFIYNKAKMPLPDYWNVKILCDLFPDSPYLLRYSALAVAMLQLRTESLVSALF